MENLMRFLTILTIMLGSAALGYLSGQVISKIAHTITGDDLGVSTAPTVMQQGPFTVKKNQMYEIEKQGRTYNVFFGPEIGYDYLYKDLIRGLSKLSERDTVVMHMSNTGGSVHTGMQIMTALKETKAHIVAKVNSPSYSMGAVIVCAADDIQLSPYAFLMYHDFSATFSGKGSESLAHIIAIRIMLTNTLLNTCVKKGVLTTEQALAVFDGVDIYIHEVPGAKK